MKKLYMIRHGITEGIEKHWYYGKTDLPLTENGAKMCAEIGKRLHLPETAQFATTGMLRTIQTMNAMFGPHEALSYPEMREMDVGIFECKSYYELAKTKAYQAWLNDSTGDFRIPGGESNRMFRARVMQGLNRLLNEPAEEIVLICHGGTICTVMLNLFPEEGESFFNWHCDPCRGYSVRFEDRKPVSFAQI